MVAASAIVFSVRLFDVNISLRKSHIYSDIIVQNKEKGN